MKKMFYTISEAAQMLEETTVTVRYWSNTFEKYLSPKRNAKGNRMYREKDIVTLKRIHYLTRDCGLSLDAVMRKLSVKDDGTDKSLEIRDALLRVREKLLQIKSSL